MVQLRTGWTLLLTLGIAAACGKESATKEIVAPDARGSTASSASRNSNSDDDADQDGKIAMRDDCDPTDPAWAPTGGCLLRRGDVRFAEFSAELSSPFSLAVVGHQAWRNDPSYLEIFSGKRVRVRNEGGRAHTFTEVAQFGGGKIPNPALNKGLITAPECPNSVDIPPGGSTEVSALSAGNHKFQCCIHPWMRAMIKVKPHDDGEDGDQ
jgi:plastocyanin